MTPELKMHLDVIVQAARQNLERDGYLLSTAFVVSGEKENPNLEIIGFPWHNDVEKEAGIIFLRGHARQKQAHTVVLLFEMWYANLEVGKTLDDWDGVPARLRKDKKEGTTCHACCRRSCWWRNERGCAKDRDCPMVRLAVVSHSRFRTQWAWAGTMPVSPRHP